MSTVWRDLTQEQLDAAYDQAAYAPNRLQILARYETDSQAVRARLGEPERRAYGPGAKEKLDIYRCGDANAPVNIFIHGGAWRSGLAAHYAFFAELFVHAGAHLVLPDFDWVQECDGDLMPIADQVQRAIAWVGENMADIGGDRSRLFISGHSSGAHLAGVALTADWPDRFGLPDDFIRGALLCSGMYDLEPVRLSARSSYVSFTDESEQALSPQRHLDQIKCPLILAYGTLETPEFQRQTRDFAEHLSKAEKQVELLVAEGCNHFEILETLANPYGLLGRAFLQQMGLRPHGAA